MDFDPAPTGAPPRAFGRGPLSLVQKLVARAAGRDAVQPGETVTCRIDAALLDDDRGDWPLEGWLRELGSGTRASDRIVLTVAADSPLAGDEALSPLAGVYRGLGVGALVLAQAGWLRPGSLVVCGDAHSAVGGAFGALMLGVDAAGMLGALSRGELRLRTPPTHYLRWTGRLNPGVSAHDMVLRARARLGALATGGAAVEHGGEAVAALSMGERMTLAAASASLGACATVLAPDRCTASWLRGIDVALDESALADWRSDEDAPGARHVFDASLLVPHVGLAEPAGDGSVPAWQARVIEDLEPTRIDRACLGGVEGAKVDDLRAAARVLAGYRIASGVQLLVAPASRIDREVAAREGILRRLVEAGATLLPDARLPSSTGAEGMLISSCARPFGRSWAGAARLRGGSVLRASPYTVAASALRGRVSDARAVLR